MPLFHDSGERPRTGRIKMDKQGTKFLGSRATNGRGEKKKSFFLGGKRCWSWGMKRDRKENDIVENTSWEGGCTCGQRKRGGKK